MLRNGLFGHQLKYVSHNIVVNEQVIRILLKVFELHWKCMSIK